MFLRKKREEEKTKIHFQIEIEKMLRGGIRKKFLFVYFLNWVKCACAWTYVLFKY